MFAAPGYEDTGTDEVWEIVESPPPDVDGDGDVNVRLWTALVNHNIPAVERLDQLPLPVVLEVIRVQGVVLLATLQRHVDFMTIVSPGTKLQSTRLEIKQCEVCV